MQSRVGVLRTSGTARAGTLLLVVAALLITGGVSRTDAATITLVATLTNAQEIPPVNPAPRPASSGTAQFVLDDVALTMTFTATISNIDVTGSQTADPNDNLTAAHIHAGPMVTPATTGPVVWGFFGTPFNETSPNDLVLTPFATGVGGTISGKWDASEGNNTTLAAQLDNIRNGRSYINFHTVQFPGGEVRGAINAVVPALSINDVTVTEGDTGTTQTSFTVSLSGSSSNTVTVNWATADGTAQSPGDYVAASGTLFFDPGGPLSQQVTINVNGDTLDEPDETFTVVLSNPTGATIADGTGVGTITDDDEPPPTLSINDVSVSEGDAGTTQASFTVSLSAASASIVSLTWATADGTAQSGADFVSTNGRLIFAPGEISQSVSVTINGDTFDEPDETFTVVLFASVGASIADDTGVGTILDDDDDEPLPMLSIDDVTVTEGDAGTTQAVFTVSLSAAAASPITVAFATVDGTAQAGADYVALSGTLTFDGGETSRTVVITIHGDTLAEADETFSVVLSNPTGASIADGTGVGTITDDDAPPSPRADLAVTKTVDNPTPTVGATVTFTVTLTNTGPDAATNVSLTDRLPAGLTFAGAITSQGTYGVATGVWMVGTVASGASATLTIGTQVVGSAPLTNTATVSAADQSDPDPSNNSDGVTVTPVPPTPTPPTLLRITPPEGPTTGGTPVTLTGSGFQPGATVTFDGVPATDVVVVNATTIEATTPPHPAGPVTVIVQNPDGQSAGLPQGFIYQLSALPPAPPPPPQPMTLSVQVWRQLPPLVSENQTELTIVPVVGGVVEALIGGVVCGQGVTDSQGRATLTVAPDPPTPGCGRDGRAISFRVNGAAAASDPLTFRSGGQAAATLILPGPMPPPRRP